LVLLESRWYCILFALRYCVLLLYGISCCCVTYLPIIRCFGYLVVAAAEDCFRDCGDHRT